MADIYNNSSSSNTKDFLGDFHDKKLLEVLEEKCQLKQFAAPKTITTSNGLTITFHTIDAFDEGIVLSNEYSDPDSTGITGATITSSVVQFGAKKIITELYEAGAVVSMVEEAQVRFGYAAAKTVDKYIQKVLLTGSNPKAGAAVSAWFSAAAGAGYSLSLSSYVGAYSAAGQADGKLKVGYYTEKEIASTAAGFNTLMSAGLGVSTAHSVRVATVRDIVTRMKMRDVAPYSDGSYALVVTPKESASLRADEEFQKWNRYNNADKMFKGEVGMVEGARIVESTSLTRLDTIVAQAKIEAETYLNFAFGNQCFALTELSGKNGIKSLMVPFSTKDHSNVLQRIASLGWKYTGSCVVLDARQGMIIVAAYNPR